MLISTVLKLITEANGKTKAKSSKPTEKITPLSDKDIENVIRSICDAVLPNENTFKDIKINARPKSAKGATKSTVYLGIPSNSRQDFVKNVAKLVKKQINLGNYTISDAVPSTDYKRITLKANGTPLFFNIQSGAEAKLADSHELMTACLCLSKINLKSIQSAKSTKDYDKILKEVKKIADSGRVIGIDTDKNAIESYNSMDIPHETNYANLAKAISAADEIKNNFPNIKKVYITGRKWHEDVLPFKVTKFSWSDFNSSDIVCSDGKKNFLGVSLKKKDTGTKDPTLINLSIMTAFAFNKEVQAEIKSAIDNFYVNVIKKNKNKIPKAKLAAVGNAVNALTWNKLISDVKDDVVAELKGKNSLFKKIKDIIASNGDELAEILTELVFKCSLSELKNKNFDFALCTGIGKYRKTKGISVERAEYKDIETISSVISELGEGKYKPQIRFDSSDANPNNNFAGLKFGLFLGKTKLSICEMELRYKGNFSSMPTFQCTMSDELKAILSKNHM